MSLSDKNSFREREFSSDLGKKIKREENSFAVTVTCAAASDDTETVTTHKKLN
jgi:hypothetical protein